MAKSRLVFFVFFAAALLNSFSQTAPAIYKVSFSDKNNTPYSFSQPLEFLSQRALERRAKHNIALDSLDIPVNPAYVQALSASLDMEVIHTSRWFNACTFRSTDTLGLDSVLDLPFVAELRQLTTKPTHATENKYLGSEKAEIGNSYDAYYGGAMRQVTMLNTHLLHDLGAKGEGVLIGVLDSGFENADSISVFAKLFDENRVLLTRDVANNEEDVYNDHWHGMSVLSCMAAQTEGELVGTAPHAQYALLTTEFVSSEYIWEEDNWAVGAEICDSLGCDVLNTSLGYTTFEDSTQNHTFADLDGETTVISIAAGIASKKGMIPVCSAGNSGSSEWYHIGAPADAKQILAVGAVRGNRTAADFSSHGFAADGRVKPDITARGEAAWGIVPWGYVPGAINGTSFSSPITAGSVACLVQLHPNKTNLEIMDAVRRSAHLFDTPNEDMGYGIPDFFIAHRLLLGEETAQDENTLLRVFPTYFTSHFFIELYNQSESAIAVDLFDMSGRQVLGKTLSVDKNHFSRVRVGAEEMLDDVTGTYALRVRMGELVLHQLLVRQ